MTFQHNQFSQIPGKLQNDGIEAKIWTLVPSAAFFFIPL